MPENYEGYLSPFSTRYASKEMQYLFSSQNKFSLWRKLWIILAESEQALGLPITDEQISEMKAHQNDIDFDAAAAYEHGLTRPCKDCAKASGSEVLKKMSEAGTVSEAPTTEPEAVEPEADAEAEVDEAA